MEIEYWKPVLGFGRRYEASNLGRIKSLERVEYMPWNGRTRVWKEKTLIPQNKDNVYLFVVLYDGTGRIGGKQRYIHRIVYEAHYGRIPNGFIVNHKDKDKTNNRADNLELITQRDNCLHGLLGRKKSSKYPGVHKESSTGYWKAMARNGKKKVYLGRFDNEELAYEAYKSYLQNQDLKYIDIRDEQKLL